ncbi:hypothetical protein AOLI_G00054890 [Acnodon oligacanthus]
MSLYSSQSNPVFSHAEPEWAEVWAFNVWRCEGEVKAPVSLKCVVFVWRCCSVLLLTLHVRRGCFGQKVLVLNRLPSCSMSAAPAAECPRLFLFSERFRQAPVDSELDWKPLEPTRSWRGPRGSD